MADFANLQPDEYRLLTTHYTPGRSQNIRGIVLHHNAANLSIAGCWQVWQTREASAHYQVDANGRIGQLVNDWDTAWHAGDANPWTIGIEHANNNFGPWTISDATLESGAHLVAALCRYYNLGRPVWMQNVFPHRHFMQTACLPVKKTELLTKNGWVNLGDISIGDEIASYRLDDGEILFSPVRRVVEPYVRDTWEMRDVEVTADHRMLWRPQSSGYRITDAAKMAAYNAQVYIPNAGHYTGGGLDLDDAQLELLIAIQADGSYMRDGDRVCGIEFHFAKQRKINAVMDLLETLGVDYRVINQSNDTTKIRIYGHGIVEWAESYLDGKKFTWKFLDMNDHQAELFLDKILDYDGCRAGNDYSSTVRQNIDVVQAIAATHNVGSRDSGNDKRIWFGNKERTINANGGLKKTAARHSKQLVSCVTVDTGLILIRQHGRTSIVGNCPGEIAGSQNAAYMRRAQEWYDAMANGSQPGPAPSGTSQGGGSAPTGDGVDSSGADTNPKRKLTVPVHYALRVVNGQWWTDVTNFGLGDDGYAGAPNTQHDLLAAWVDHGSLKYRTHNLGGDWNDWVYKADKNDTVNGCAGIPGVPIDGVQFYYTTPQGEPFSQAYYRSQTVARAGWLPVCSDDGTNNDGLDGWAGIIGEPLDRLQLAISDGNPF